MAAAIRASRIKTRKLFGYAYLCVACIWFRPKTAFWAETLVTGPFERGGLESR
jgi:hypothetical protein